MSDSETTPRPWQIHPSLKKYRLEAVARIFRDVRAELAPLHEPGQGDTQWSFGCRVYSRTCYALSAAARGVHGEWLHIIKDSGLVFVFGIGTLPLRFYRGNPNRAEARRRICLKAEADARQLVMDLFPGPDFHELVPRLVIEPDELGEVAQVVLVWLDRHGVPHHPYSISLDDAAGLTPIIPPTPPDLSPPPLGFDKNRKKKLPEAK